MTTLTLEPCCLAAIEEDERTGEASCVFGCGRRVDPDTKFCLFCRDHSANAMECAVGHTLELWGDSWERTA